MGGMETYSKALAEALEPGIALRRIVLPGHADGSVPGALELLGFGLRTAGKLLFARAPSEVTHVADMASWPLALCARLRSPGAAIVISAHGTDVSYPARGGFKGRLYGAWLRLGARLLRGARVIANSAATARQAESFGFRDTVVVPLAAELDSPPERCEPGRAILFAGRLIPLKGCSWFIREVLPRLPGEMSLDVAGTTWDADETAALDTPRVRYLGKLDQPELWQACADALCVVIPNIDLPNGQFEGFGLVAPEAAAAGGVVLAARHGGLCEAVIDGGTGFLLPPGDAIAWSAKIAEIAAWTQAERTAFTDHSQALCAERFSWDRVARDTLAVYRGELPSVAPEAVVR